MLGGFMSMRGGAGAGAAQKGNKFSQFAKGIYGRTGADKEAGKPTGGKFGRFIRSAYDTEARMRSGNARGQGGGQGRRLSQQDSSAGEGASKPSRFRGFVQRVYDAEANLRRMRGE